MEVIESNTEGLTDEQIGVQFQRCIQYLPAAIQLIAVSVPEYMSKKVSEDVGKALAALEVISEVPDLGQNILNAAQGMGLPAEPVKGGVNGDEPMSDEDFRREMARRMQRIQRQMLDNAETALVAQRQSLTRETRERRMSVALSLLMGIIMTYLLFSVLYLAYVVPINTAAALAGAAAAPAAAGAAVLEEASTRVNYAFQTSAVVEGVQQARQLARYALSWMEWAVSDYVPAVVTGTPAPAAPVPEPILEPIPPNPQNLTDIGAQAAVRAAEQVSQQTSEMMFGVMQFFFGRNFPWWFGPGLASCSVIFFAFLSHIAMTRAYAGRSRGQDLANNANTALNTLSQLEAETSRRALEAAQIRLLRAQATTEMARATFIANIEDRGRLPPMEPPELLPPAPAAPALPPAPPAEGGAAEASAVNEFLRDLKGGKKKRRTYRKNHKRSR